MSPSAPLQKAALSKRAPYALGDFSTNTIVALNDENSKLELITLPGGGQAQNITVYLRDGGSEGPFSLAVGTPIVLSGKMVSRVVGNSGVSASVLWAISPEAAPPVFASGPPTRSPGSSVGATFQAVPVQLMGRSGFSQQEWANASAAPDDGFITVTLLVTSGQPTLSDGTTSNPILAADTLWHVFRFNCRKGVTYTFGGTGLLFLGHSGVAASDGYYSQA